MSQVCQVWHLFIVYNSCHVLLRRKRNKAKKGHAHDISQYNIVFTEIYYVSTTVFDLSNNVNQFVFNI